MAHQAVMRDEPGAPTRKGAVTAGLETGCLYFASEKAVVEAELGRCPGVFSVEMNPVAQTTTVTYDPAVLTPLANPTFGVTAGAVANSNGGGRTLTAFNPSAGTLNISVFGTEFMLGGGVLVDLNFTVVGVPGTSSASRHTAGRG